jgi:hypothetical protein
MSSMVIVAHDNLECDPKHRLGKPRSLSRDARDLKNNSELAENSMEERLIDWVSVLWERVAYFNAIGRSAAAARFQMRYG